MTPATDWYAPNQQAVRPGEAGPAAAPEVKAASPPPAAPPHVEPSSHVRRVPHERPAGE